MSFEDFLLALDSLKLTIISLFIGKASGTFIIVMTVVFSLNTIVMTTITS